MGSILRRKGETPRTLQLPLVARIEVLALAHVDSKVSLVSDARLLLDAQDTPTPSWVTQKNPWVSNDIATFLRFDGLSKSIFLSVANPWGSVVISRATDSCLDYLNRWALVFFVVVDS